MLIMSFSSPNSFPEGNNIQSPMRILPDFFFFFSGACYFYTGKERMNQRPLEKNFFFFNARPPLALSQTMAPYLPLRQSCLPSFHVQTSWRKETHLGPCSPEAPAPLPWPGFSRNQGQAQEAAAPALARPGPRRAGAPQPAERGAQAGQARGSRRGLPRTRVESAPASLPPAFSRSN